MVWVGVGGIVPKQRFVEKESDRTRYIRQHAVEPAILHRLQCVAATEHLRIKSHQCLTSTTQHPALDRKRRIVACQRQRTDRREAQIAWIVADIVIAGQDVQRSRPAGQNRPGISEVLGYLGPRQR